MPDEKESNHLDFYKWLGGQELVDAVNAGQESLQRYVTKPQQSNAPWQNVGAIKEFTANERDIHFICENGKVELFWIAEDCLRLRFKTTEGDFEAPFSYAVFKTEWQPISFEVNDGVESIEIRSSALLCYVNKSAFALTVETLDGNPICRDTLGMQYRTDGSVGLSMALHPQETSYGMGERTSSLNLRGKRFIHWNDDNIRYERNSDPLYYCVPFYLGMHGNIAYGVFWDNSHRGSTDIGSTKNDELRFEAENGELRYYLFAGTDVKRTLARYTELTGRIPLPPLWVLGYQQGRFSYYPQEKVIELANEFRRLNIPCDVIYLDIHYMDGFRVFTWDKKQFPEFETMISDLHEIGFKIVAITDPGVKIDSQYPLYKTGIEKDVFLKYADEELVKGAVFPGLCHFPDFTKAVTREWWREQSSAFLNTGIDGLVNDMAEIAVFTPDGRGTLPDNTRHDKEGLQGNHIENHNVYGMLMGRASAEALAEQRPTKRQVNIIRSGFAGAQRYAMAWTGDNKSDWDHLKLSIPMILNMGLSGAAMVGADIGGFRADGNAELFTRWLQAACLMPFFRSHSSNNTAEQEPWSFGQLYENINRATIQLRYQLLPYLYSVVAQASEYGWSIVRPVFMAEPDNKDIRSIDDCYMLGDSLLAAPVLEEGAKQRRVYLPAGKWYDFWTNEIHTGGRYTKIEAPLERLPLFVRAGTVLPLWENNPQHVTEKPLKTLTLRVYPGHLETVLYEDAGEGLDYQRGDYRWVYITCDSEATKVVVNRRVAGRYKPSYDAMKVEILLNNAEPDEVRIDRRPAPVWFCDDNLLDFTIDNFNTIEVTLTRHQNDPTVARHF
jgi:alpha-glucosidase